MQGRNPLDIWRLRCVGAIAISLSCSICYGEEPLEGRWIAVDRDDPTIRATIELKVHDGEMRGVMVALTKDGKPMNPVCDKCDGELKNAHVVGATFITGLYKEKGKWIDGTVIDLRQGWLQGTRASCEIDLVGEKAHIFGYFLLRAFNGESTWEREPADRDLPT